MTNFNASILTSGCAKRLFARRATVSFACLLFLVGLLPAVGGRAFAQTPQKSAGLVRPTQGSEDVRSLEEGKPIEREMLGGQSHSYQLNVVSGHYLSLMIEQKGIDVVVKLFAPDGKLLIEVDSPNGTQGPEPVRTIAEQTGAYRLEVSSLEKAARPGRYDVKLVELRLPTQQDRDRLAARQIFDEGVRLHNQATRESVEAALKKYQEALPLYQGTGDRSEQFAILFNMSGAHRFLGDSQKAIPNLNQALQIAQALEDKSGQFTALINIGDTYRIEGAPQKAVAYLNQALQMAQALGDKAGQALSLRLTASVYRTLGELEKALQAGDDALKLYQGARDKEAYMLKFIGEVYSFLGEQDEARERYDQALRLYQVLGDKNGEAGTLHSIAYSYVIQHEFQKGLDYFSKALASWQLTKNKRQEAMEQSFISNEYARAGERQRALDHSAQALLLNRNLQSFDEATILTNVGHTHNKLGEFEKALARYSEALTLWQSQGDKRGEAITLKHISSALRDLGKLDEAQVNIEKSLAILEFMREQAGTPELQSSFVAGLFDFYQYYVDLLMRMHEANPKAGNDLAALAFTEKIKLRSLKEILIQASVDLRKEVDGALLERERSINERITARLDDLTKLLRGKYVDAQRSAAERELDALKDEKGQVQAEIRKRSPHFAALTQPQPLTVREIQQQVLDENTMLLEYALGDERSYLWEVTSAGVLSHQLPPKAKIEEQARRVYQLLTARQPAQGLTLPQQRAQERAADAEYQTQVKILSNMLLEPVAVRLGTKRLVIVADGALQYLPFAVLPVPETPATTKKSLPSPLIIDHEIVSLPSASVLAVLRRELADRGPAARMVAVLADPVFELDDERVKLSLASTESSGSKQTQRAQTGVTSPATSSQLKRALRSVRGIDDGINLRRLLFSRNEADAILSVSPEPSGLKALDFQANRRLAMSDELSQYRVIHFSTHGLLDSRHPELSGLVLSLVDETGKPEEGFLRLHEIYNLRLNADLVVLSACQTGLGKEVRGEGLIGLTRGFMYAGAPRVMASLWQVDDAATAALMKRFYQNMLQEKLRPAAALRAAQIEMLKRRHWQSPYYWGAFVLQGEWK
jgi:CHAT domain-containing protein/tetratricopeptide (TPR) repeat protein